MLHKKTECVLTGQEAENLAGQYRILVPKKRRYYIETLYSHYAHTHYQEHLDVTGRVIAEKYPEYRQSFLKVMGSTSGYMFNMFVMEKELSDRYCEWLFDILSGVEKCMGAQELSSFQGRFYGRISEIIFNVWLDCQIRNGTVKREEIKAVGCIHMEKINWIKKGSTFLKAKFFRKRYEGSF